MTMLSSVHIREMPYLGKEKERTISRKLQVFWRKRTSEATMSSAKPEQSNTSSGISDDSLEGENILKRVSSLPLVSSVCDLVSSNYTCIKAKSAYLQTVCDEAEKGVKALSGAAASRAQPILTTLEPQLATANKYACRGLDTVEEKLPILQQTADQVVFDTKELMSSKVTGAKDVVTRRLSGMACRTKDAVQGSMRMTTSMVTSSMSVVMGTRMGQLAKNSVEAVLVKSHAFVDHYLLITDDDMSKNSVELRPCCGSQGEAPGQPAEELLVTCDGYMGCLISLLNKCQRYASQRSQHHARHASWSLQRIFHHHYEEWKAWLVALYYTITLPLRTAYLIILFTIEELAAKFQENVPQASYLLEELQTALLAIECLQSLCRRIFSRVWEKMSEEENLNALLNYVAQTLPFCFLASYSKYSTCTDCTMRALKIIQKMQMSKENLMELKESGSGFVAAAS
ncbi:perilipin-3-like isoform X2 [Hemicordylus capensis]|uniref:perilipin-3-like isoform X2 n=2 Tax=Hemicordylus capensis TaxID=884348 RepID=UPI0023023675|nr:perilipin-3-like isoform X2 [Hemicordylus capensis]